MASSLLLHAALLSPPYSTLTYEAPLCFPADLWVPGLRIAVPLGKSCRAAVLLAIEETTPASTPPPGLKPIAWPLERTPLLSPAYIDLARQLGLRQGGTPGRILGGVLPARLRSAKIRWRFFGEEKNRTLYPAELAALDDAEKTHMATLWVAGQAVCLAGEDPLERERCTLTSDPPWAIRPRATKQLALLEYLYHNGAVTRRHLLDHFGPEGAATLTTLAQRGLIAIAPLMDAPDAQATHTTDAPAPPVQWQAPFSLTDKQQDALNSFITSLDSNAPDTRLLHGVTGSGKTAVYLALAAATLSRGKSMLLLAPEVALALKLYRDVQTFLPGAPLHLFHGYQSPQERENIFRAVAENDQPAIIVGTRSALFLPVRKLGVIILDEEHDASFKQDEGLHYQAKEVAWYRANVDKALLVLGSATPDVKTFYATRQGQLPVHTLPDRVGGGTLPAVRLISLPKGLGSGDMLAAESTEALIACVERGDQAVILLNRRGYAPLMYCLSCNTVMRCPHCDISLTYHKGRERVVCHYCGHSTAYPSPCPACGGMHFLPMGAGTEKLEETLTPKLPVGTRILRLDRDSTRRPGRMEEILSAFAHKEASVLVGTQMLSKGHHFPDVTLVIAADADMGLNLPDYRAAERTFQLLLQASGRAGRGEKAGEVLIQTRDTSHYCWEFVRSGDYEGFYQREIALREKRRYPPFTRLALLRVSFPITWGKGQEKLDSVAAAVKERARALGLTVLGPAPAPLALLKGYKRFHFLIKAEQWGPVRELYTAALHVAGHGELRVTLDLDPVNML